MNSEFFVRIEEPKTLRKELLETSKITINLLKKQESIKKIKIEKRQAISNIRKTNSEIKLLLERLEKLMPDISIENKIEQESKIAKNIKTATKTIETKKTQKNIKQSNKSIEIDNASLEKLESLERELKELEEKIKKL
jgi:phage-related protein